MDAQGKNGSPSVATVDTHELVSKMTKWEYAERGAPALEAWNELIAHIDAHIDAHVAAKDAEIKTLTAALNAQGELTVRYQEIALSAQAAAPVVADIRAKMVNISSVSISEHKRDALLELANRIEESQGTPIPISCGAALAIRAILQPSPAPVAMTDEQIELAECFRAAFDTPIARRKWDGGEAGEYCRKHFRAILAAQQEAV